MDTSLPIEVGLDKAKREILQTINQIGTNYNIPSSFIVMILQQIVYETRLNTYETITTNYDIKVPNAVENIQSNNSKSIMKKETAVSSDKKS
jgi:hypothetical protein